MNYYIQGDAAKADKIKAAFEKLGYDVTGFDACNDNILFFTYKLQNGGQVLSTTNANLYTASIIKTHPDYKELELPVKPKFKKGDWIACDTDSFTLSIKSVKDGNYYFHQGASLPIKDIDEHYHLWTIADAKDGDVLAAHECYVIFKEIDGLNIKCYCAYHYMGFNPTLYKNTLQNKTAFNPATKEQRDLLFSNMKEAGYEWDADKKELHKIQPHYDISNFHAGMPVLVRDYDNTQWRYVQFSHCVGKDNPIMFNACGNTWEQCIPFEGNEHLLGATDMPSEEYINW